MMLAAAPLPAFAQGTASAPLSGKLLITGSSIVAPLIEELGKRFRTRHPGVVITVEAGGSERAVADALAGRADIGMASRELNPKEQALFAIPIARDGMVFVVRKDNPVRGLTRAQATELLTGKIANWRALGGVDARIETVARAPGRTAGVEIVAHYLGIAPTAIRAAHVVAGDYADVVRLIAANRNAIAFLSIGLVEDLVQKGQPLKPLALDGIVPGSGSIRDGTWPISRTHNLITRRVPAGVAKAVIEFMLSPAAREVILDYDFVPYLN
jgi:phosphate transport system substrate-binding protein